MYFYIKKMRSCFFVFLFFTAFFVEGQIPYLFNRLSSSDGLNTNKINHIFQDSKGFLWIGTENGIQRFDGRKFINFRSDGLNNSMPPFGVDQILDAGNGNFWIRQGTEIGLYDPVLFKYNKIPIYPGIQHTSNTDLWMSSDSKGNIFLYTRWTELTCYDKETNSFTNKNLPVKIPEGWSVNFLFEDAKEKKYYICSDNGLAIYDEVTQELQYKDHNPGISGTPDWQNLKFVYNFYIDSQKTWWVFYYNASLGSEAFNVMHIDPKTGNLIDSISAKIMENKKYEQYLWIFETTDNQLWIGGVNSLLSYDRKNHTFTQNIKLNKSEFDINCREIKQMFEDEEKSLWFCTDNGLYVIGQGQENAYNYVFENSPNDEVLINSILQTEEKENWIGTWGNGILVFDSYFVNKNIDLYKGLSEKKLKMVWSLCQQEPGGLIWSGCQYGHIVVFDPLTKKVVHKLNPPAMKGASVRQIVADKNGNLWFGTQNGQLVKWNKNDIITNQNFQNVNEFQAAVFSLKVDSAGRIWVGTNKMGLFVMDSTGTKELFHFSEEHNNVPVFFGNSIYDIEQYNDSIFFISTGLLNILNINTGEIKRLSQYDGLPGNNVFKVIKDSEGILWFASNNGLGSYNYSKNMFASYTERNGFVYAGKPAYAKYRMKNGEIWFGGENSLYGFMPEKISYRSIPVNVTLTDFKIFNTFIPLDSLLSLNEIRLKPEQNSFTIYFSSLSYAQQDNLIYYYKLEGVNNDWIKADRGLAAQYTILPPGDYTFKVKCVNLQGEESENITSLNLIVLPHFYQTWWFLILVIAAVSWLTYFIYRQRIVKLLAVERIRNKVARDLHDDVGSTLSTINILSSMAKTKLLTDPVKTSEYISKITNNSQQMMEAMDDIVWSIKPDNDNMQKIVARMREYASSILEPKDIDIEFKIDNRIFDLKLNMETRRDVFLVFKEAVNNSAKYSHCTKVDIKITTENKKLLVNIIDNGTGFDIQTADYGNGLGNMEKRAETLNGSIRIESKESIGTEISLTIPVTN